MKARSFDVIILGAGAAGLMCAIEAGAHGRRVLVIEHQESVGKKIRISGGGRCNFTNREAAPRNYLSQNPRFCTSALARFTPDDFVARVERHGIPFHEKKDGQLFCNGSAQEIIDMLLKECAASNVTIETSCRISEVGRSDGFHIGTIRGELSANALVVATGGLSVPKTGATDLGYRVAGRFGLRIIEPVPGLVPFLWNEEDRKRYDQLSGVSMPVGMTCNTQTFIEDLLFTHRGISGPAALQLSSYWNTDDPVSINLLPERTLPALIEEQGLASMTVGSLLSRVLPRRFVQAWLDEPLAKTALSRFSRSNVKALSERLSAWRIIPAGTEGFAKAEVTRGGVDTTELSSKTMESKKIPGLFFIGEVVDVTGWLGGYNFQWAWASGHAAGEAL